MTTELQAKKKAILADIGSYFLRNYDRDSHDASMLELVAELDALDQIEKPAECTNGCPPNTVCDFCQGSGGLDVVPQPAIAEPVAWRYQDARGHFRYRGYVAGFDTQYAILKPVALSILQQPDVLAAAPTPPQPVSEARDAERTNRYAEISAAERDIARECYARAVRILTGIHALLYPPRFTDHDGHTWQFKSPLAEEQMQELSDRIRALPDEIAAIEAMKGTK